MNYDVVCRGLPFMHVRMQDSANVEINNPMYLKEEYDYEATEALSPEADEVTSHNKKNSHSHNNIACPKKIVSVPKEMVPI